MAEVLPIRDDDEDPRFRQPPRAIELEQALLGAVLNRQAVFLDCSAVAPQDFADPFHGRLWALFGEMQSHNGAITLNTVRALLQDDEQLVERGGIQYLLKLYAAVVTYDDLSDTARMIRDFAKRRRLMQIGAKLMADAQDTPGADKHVADVERQLFTIDEGRNRDGEQVHHVSAIVDRTIARIERAHQNKGVEGRVRSGLAVLDELLVLEPGDFLVLAGAASMGKSALLDCFLEANAVDGQVGLLDNREMTPEQLVMRRLARRTGINVKRQQLGQIEPPEWSALMKAGEEISGQLLYIADNPSMTPSGLRSEIKRLKRKGPLHVVGVDYMQLMMPDTKNPKFRTGEVGEITRALRLIAKEEHLVMVGLSQLSRGVDNRDDHRPNMGDLRESGSIEQDATHVVFVYRDEYYLPRHEPKGKHGKPAEYNDTMEWLARMEASRGVADLIVAKSRNGITSSVRVGWDGPMTRFHDLDLSTPGGPVQATFEPLGDR